jgi:DNA polymerase III sliding clamp (beta) subunit (PCNA family)
MKNAKNPHAILLTKASLAVVACASTDAGRVNLQGVHVTPTHTMATDGYMLAMVSHQTATDPADFPAVGGVAQPTEPLMPCTIPTDAVKKMLAAFPKANKYQPILDHALVDVVQSNATGSLHVVTTDIDTTTPVQAKKIDMAFPDVAQVVPSTPPGFTIGLDAGLLVTILQAAIKAKGKSRSGQTILTFGFDPDAKDPTTTLASMRITGTNDAGQELTFLLMPCRV